MLPTVEGELTAVDDNGSFTMYALVFGNVDRQGDVIEPNSVMNVDEFVEAGWIALNHDQKSAPIAIIDSAVQDEHGLKVTGHFHSHPRAQEVRSYVKERLDAGKQVPTSIGYLILTDGERYEKVNGRTVHYISKLAVYEASFVNLPANPEAEVLVAKSHSGLDPVESEDDMGAAAVLKEVKRVLGLSSKGIYKADGEDVEKLRGFQKAIASHAEFHAAHAKAFKAMSEEMDKCLKNFTSGQQQEADPRNEGNVADKEEDDDQGEDTPQEDEAEEENEEEEDQEEEEEKPKAKKAVKAKKAKAKQADETQEEKALKAYRNDLKRRALSLKFPNRAS